MHATDTFVRLGQIPGLDIEVKLIPMVIAVMLATLLAHSNLAVIVSGGVGKNGSTVAVSVGLNKYYYQLRVSVSVFRMQRGDSIIFLLQGSTVRSIIDILVEICYDTCMNLYYHTKMIFFSHSVKLATHMFECILLF